MPSPRASSSYSREKESGGGPTRPASRRARMCSTTSRCSITRSVATATTTGYRRSSSSGDTSTRSRVSKKVGAIHVLVDERRAGYWFLRRGHQERRVGGRRLRHFVHMYGT